MWGPRPNLLRLIVSRVANSTLVYDMPLNAGTPKAIRTCPTPSKPVASARATSFGQCTGVSLTLTVLL